MLRTALAGVLTFTGLTFTGLASAGLGCAAILASGCSGSPPAPPPRLAGDFEAAFLRARRAILDLVDGGSAGGLPRAEIEALHAERPDDARVLAYLGSLRLLEGKAEVIPWKKGELCMEGLRLLDRAVEAAPDDLELRFVRGRSTLPLPFFFRREAQARDDIFHVARRAVEATLAGTIEREVAAAALLEEGILREEGSEPERARQSWSAAAELAPDSRYGRAARARLERL
jgi:hypothetical protein